MSFSAFETMYPVAEGRSRERKNKMSKLKTFISLLKTPYKMIEPLGSMGLLNWMPDSTYVKLVFRAEMGYRPDLDNPRTFNEKLQWLKVFDHRPEYTDLVDKLRAKEVIGSKIGFQYIVPIYGAWERAEDIPFDELPEKYVLKCNHDQGSVIIVSEKRTIDKEETIRILNKKLKRNIYYGIREYPYKNVKPKVFAEKYLGEIMTDYKFYCFNGKPLFLYCSKGMLRAHVGAVDFYDLSWNPMPFYRTDYERLGQIPKPEHLDEMIEISKILSKDVPFVRIDLFEVSNQVYFSEFTLCPASGYMPFVPKEYDAIVGEWLDIPRRQM